MDEVVDSAFYSVLGSYDYLPSEESRARVIEGLRSVVTEPYKPTVKRSQG